MPPEGGGGDLIVGADPLKHAGKPCGFKERKTKPFSQKSQTLRLRTLPANIGSRKSSGLGEGVGQPPNQQAARESHGAKAMGTPSYKYVCVCFS